jgi:translocation and assembly module TamB
MLQLNEGRIFYQGGPIDNPGLDIRASRKIDEVEAGIHLTGSADSMDMKLFSDTPMEDSEILSWLLSGQNSVSGSKGDAALSPAAAALSKIGGGALLKSVNPLGAVDMEDFVDLNIGGGKEASDVSLVMGKQIYKDLYISYGKDLTKEGGGFKARYDLDYGFSVESETSSAAAGADLLWSLER